MERIQEWIHKFEEGEGVRIVRLIFIILVLLGLAALYDVRQYSNFASAEAMDSAQLARNLAQGKGYTTDFVRPFSIYLVEKQRGERGERGDDLALLKKGHPDLTNPPVYPLLLAGLMKVLPFDFNIPQGVRSQRSPRYQPEILIAFFNQALFFLAMFLTFRLARRLFDPTVAWITVLVLAGTELLWQFSVSGLSTMLLMVMFLALSWLLVVMEEAAREGQRGRAWFLGAALLCGALVALGSLTRYSFGWLILPVLLFFGVFFPQRRLSLCLVSLLTFLAVLSPWLIRNHHWSGSPFGTSVYALVQDTEQFPENRLERSLTPDFSAVKFNDCARKFSLRLGELLRNDLPKFGGNWIIAFSMVGLLLPFVRVGLHRLRVFLLGALAVLVFAQALGHTQLSADTPIINSENLLVILAPIFFVYGVGLFTLIIEHFEFPVPALRHVVNGAFVLAVSAPLVLRMLPPREHSLVYPPYFPPWIQYFGDYMQEEELVMSDMPWAMAWYGRRQCVWTTLNVQDKKNENDFYAINDLRKPVQGLYLTTLTMDGRLFSQLLRGQDWVWGKLAMDGLMVTRQGLPRGFPLQFSPEGDFVARGHLFLADRPRW